jgi:hypothetical protein
MARALFPLDSLTADSREESDMLRVIHLTLIVMTAAGSVSSSMCSFDFDWS